MDIEYALLADYAELVGSKLYLMGGGWDTNNVAETPAALRVSVALGVRVSWEEIHHPIPVTLSVEDDDGRQYLRLDGTLQVGRPAGMPDGSTQLAQLAANLQFTAPAAGGYTVRILAGSGEGVIQRSLPFRVVAKT